jgi:hypothetical protein
VLAAGRFQMPFATQAAIQGNPGDSLCQGGRAAPTQVPPLLGPFQGQ